ncbi:glycogen debranching protein GlgX [Treponema primitia]|uniref:glycogen debranching protein GlgX n=1 Tax=Treponema primitia TaxID=88058 RepID=UPI00047506C5|nr:glycogen debranching protein GlgX [Treponema primitia]
MAFGHRSVEIGKALPLGAELTETGVNFSIFSRNATAVTLILFESDAPDSAYEEISLDKRKNKTGDIWHCHIRGLGALTQYLYRVDGPYIPEKGFRFNANKTLLDPYAKALTDLSNWDMTASVAYNADGVSNDLSFSYTDDIRTKPRCIVVDNSFDWQGDIPLNYPLRFSVLYETHVRGLTAHPNSGVKHPGTYRGVIEKIPFFKELGITSLEFLPIQEFYEGELSRKNPRTGKTLVNYWGYSTVAFFAPKGSYAWDKSPGGQVREFKEMVRELHKAGIEVILDIVFNHTAEGNEWGPSYSFRGLDNTLYYMLDANKRYYKNYSGCGNTVNCNHPVVRTFIISCLQYWVTEMHVDGFRFDLGSILGRDQNGQLMENPPLLERIAEEPVLSATKIIAEAWDAGGAYQVGWFPGGRWAEWNDRYRDEVRRYWRGDPHHVRHLATRLSGSSDLYLRDGRKPFHSINFLTSHDGFTLRDLVSYNGKHNDENGEENRDGGDNNSSYNYGAEGPSRDPNIENIRERQLKNFVTTLMISIGTPMLLGGDEFARTQGGNNNAYCQDNEISWYDWTLMEKNSGIFRFVKEMIAFRLRHHGFMRPEFYTGRDGNYNAIPDISWFDEKGAELDWEKTDPCLALRMDGSRADILADRDDNDFFIMFNSGAKQVKFKVCEPMAGKKWYLAVDTSLPSPDDFLSPGQERLLPDQDEYFLQSRSMVILLSKVM